MSGGRVELGLGAGWFDDEHTAYGIPFPDAGRAVRPARGAARDRHRPVAHAGRLAVLVRGPALHRRRVAGAAQAGAARRAADHHRRLRGHPDAPPGRPLRQRVQPARSARSRCSPSSGPACARPARPSTETPTTSIYSAALVLCCGENDEELERRAAAIGRGYDDRPAPERRGGHPVRGARHVRRLRRGRRRARLPPGARHRPTSTTSTWSANRSSSCCPDPASSPDPRLLPEVRMPITHLPADTEADAVAEAVSRDGAVIIDRLAPAGLLDRIAEELAPSFSATPTGPDDFSGHHTRRTGGLVARSPAVARAGDAPDGDWPRSASVLGHATDVPAPPDPGDQHRARPAGRSTIHRDQWAFDFFPFPAGLRGARATRSGR